MKTALFIPTMDGGGAERVMMLLAKEFSYRGHEVDLIVARAVGPYLKQMPPNVRLVDLKSTKPLTAIPALIRYLRKERPSSVLSSLFNANIALLIAKKISGIPVRCVVREANTISYDLRVSRSISAPITAGVIRRCYAWADVVVSLSYGAADDLTATTRFPRNKIKVIYNPIDIKMIHKKANEESTHPWLIDRDIPTILGIGRFCEQKDFSTLIRAFSIVVKYKNAKLIILGDGELRSQLEALVHALNLSDKVELPGFIDNPYQYLSRSSVFVLSSRWEGLGNVLIEALACDVPIIATNCPCGPGEVLQNGKYGRLVPVGDTQALSSEILRVIDDDILRFNKTEALSRFDINNITERFIEVLSN
ncbi:MAG: glycosyltransferase [Desulfobacteraceae bacterium]|nr:glycosyltransferase [Desulfobacteraceae bacterium]MBC2748988.1 glycosyltransferase [Desulfobacteraceae bacterium]